MKVWPIFAGVAAGSLVYTVLVVHREGRQPVPPFAGRICDNVWRETRAGEPTVSWFRSCIKHAATIYATEPAK